jgi:hypothetical protein
MSFVASFTHQISQIASKVAIKLYLVKASVPIAVTELPPQFNGIIEDKDDDFTEVCSEEQQQIHAKELVAQKLRDQIAQLQVKIANSAHISLSGNPAPAVELSCIDMPALCITVTPEEMLAFQTDKTCFDVESLRRKGVIIFVK